MTAPPGWTKIRTDLHSWLWFRLVGAGDPAGWTWTFSGAFEAVGEILAYSGVDPVRPVDASSGADNPDSQRVTAPSLSTSRPGCLLVYFATIHPTARAIDPPAGMSERNDVNAAVEIESADELWATPGPTGERTGTATAAAHNIGQLVALAPA